MVTVPSVYLESELDGEEPGGYVVVNVDARTTNPYQVLEDDENGSAYFSTLREAREACKRSRVEGDNDDIYVYALVGVREAIQRYSSHFALA